ncbi:hypothetical protein [Labrenzia sp. DG1229]|uniref:hypothetical protein n=1 Tax=Labrenzia sp. DG1229 TaxID=681847 RepID=UPI00048E5E53|nr:hypothetical protein [Labrenzia sp. DG1229]
MDLKAVGEKVAVGVLSAVLLGALALIWNFASEGGLVRLLGGVPARDLSPQLTILHDRIESLENNSSAEVPAFPTGAIVAFDGGRYEKVPDGRLQTGCPSGWIRFEQAAGRFIIGSDSYPGFEPNAPKYKLRSEGGREDIPVDGEHRHRRGDEVSSNFGDDNKDNNYVTNHEGAHDHGGANLPPYIALYFCKKN